MLESMLAVLNIVLGETEDLALREKVAGEELARIASVFWGILLDEASPSDQKINALRIASKNVRLVVANKVWKAQEAKELGQIRWKIALKVFTIVWKFLTIV
jgi:hypothetical protein